MCIRDRSQASWPARRATPGLRDDEDRAGHLPRWLMARGNGTSAAFGRGRALTHLEIAFDSLMLQHFSRVERVTGIEPALSAWELPEPMGVCLVLCDVRGHERPGVSLGRPP